MLIGKNYKIECPDNLNVIVYKFHKGSEKNGKVIADHWTTEGFYSTPASALNGLIRMEVKATELKDLQTVVNKITELENTLLTAIRTHRIDKESLRPEK
jgi:hypothetical protein